ncbi:MAG: NADH-quinone oxidoreductase subunit C [Bacteroidota bacterium]
MQNAINNLIKKFGASDAIEKKPGLTFITVEQEKAISAVTYLRDMEGYTVLTLLTAVDWIEDGIFQLTYLVNNPELISEIGVRVMIDREKAEMESAHDLWPNVQVYQRELKEMYGINFPGSPRIDENFLLEGWDDKPPYRRDFDTKEYAEKTYFPRPGRESNDPAEYMKKKMYPNNPSDYTNKKYNPNR